MRPQGKFYPSLEGIRGYAFLLVFFIHYTNVTERPTELYLYPAFLMYQSAWFLVPIFFVLSGFLITKILLNTRDREGYFRVFYFRRFVRLFPLYYITLFVLVAVVLINQWQMHRSWLLYLVYLQNLRESALGGDNHFVTGHLWSLAIEEQFYLLWPVLIWFLRGEKAILRFSYGFIAACFILRLAWPLLHISYSMGYYLSPARADAIIIGAVLAIYYERGVHWNRLITLSKILIPVVWLTLVAVVLVRGNGFVTDYIGVAAMIPAQNLLGACFVILALEPDGLVTRLCSKDLICRVGRLSYGLYIFHDLYRLSVFQPIGVRLGHYMPSWLAMTLSGFMALALTFALAALAYKLIEEPAMRWKDRVKYGERTQPLPIPTAELLPGELGLAG